MTDDESLKAFENEMRRQLHRVVKDKDGLYVAARTHEKWVLWQAAVEWATKRERKTFLTVCAMYSCEYQCAKTQIMNAFIEQEPQP